VIVAAGNGTVFWYLTRGSGVVALLLLTAAVILGVVNALRWRGERWPRFAVNAAHRNLTLLSIVFVVIHVVTTVADGYAPIGLKDAVVPFLSPYRPLWLGLGAVAFDLLLALAVTSLLRRSVPARVWRGLHWLAYAAWPIALVHALGTGSDARTGWFETLGVVCLAAVALAALARAALGGGLPAARLAGGAAAIAAPLAVLAWYQSGPLRQGWASRAGTPAAILARKARPAGSVLTSAAVASEPASFTSSLTGTVTSSQENGLAQVSIRLRLRDDPHGAARIDLRGVPSGSGVVMTAGGVSFVPSTTGTVYTGSIVALEGTDVGAVVRDAAGDRLLLRFRLSIDSASGAVTGTVRTGSQGDSE
jgi:methionine sulfoxide reductase heme-binding subunit